jgi:hypothetical protein
LTLSTCVSDIKCWPAVWLKSELNGKVISSLEYAVLCDSVNAGAEKEATYTFSMNLKQLKELMREQALVDINTSTYRISAIANVMVVYQFWDRNG